MINFLNNHKVELFGFIGASVTVIAPYLEELGIVAQVFAGIGGIIVVSITIYIKIIEAITKTRALKKINKSRGKANGKS